MTMRAGNSLRQRLQHRCHRCRTTGRRANRHQQIPAGARRRRVGLCDRRRPTPASHRSAWKSSRSWRGGASPPVMSTASSVGMSTASSAPWPMASKTNAALARTLAVTIRIGHGELDMMVRITSHAVHADERQRHQDEIGRVSGTVVDRLGGASAIHSTSWLAYCETVRRNASADDGRSAMIPILTPWPRRSGRRRPAAACRRGSSLWSGSTRHRPRAAPPIFIAILGPDDHHGPRLQARIGVDQLHEPRCRPSVACRCP